MEKRGKNKLPSLQNIIDYNKQYQLSSVIDNARQEEVYNTEKFMDKTMSELLQNMEEN